MLQFPKEFFEPEIKLNFEISSKMKHVWAMEIEILEEIARICKKYNIMYFADCGTLLGAVRHSGFIPWDDDIDIAMKRDDYKKFFAVAEKELPEKWILCNIYSDKTNEWDATYGRITNGNIIGTNEDHLKENHGCPYIVGIDIFPLDYFPKEKDEAECVCRLMQYIMETEWKVKQGIAEGLEMMLCDIEEMCKIALDRGEMLLRQLLQLRDALGSMYAESEAEELVSATCTRIISEMPHYNKEWYAGNIYMPFQNILISVPVGYDQILKVRYGDDYMIPKQEYNGHDYPFYKWQDEIIRNSLDKEKEWKKI